jgi:spore coat protein U-like protein
MRIGSFVFSAFAIAWSLAMALPAAAAGNYCSVSGATTASIGNYNPFTGSQFYQALVTLNLRRYEGSNSRTTALVDFYLTQPAGSPAFDVRYNGASVLYTEPTQHALSWLFPVDGTVFHAFGASSAPDTVALPFVVTIPPGLDLEAGEPIVFDVVYVCLGSGLNSVLTPATLRQAITININVLSALQASYVGPALDFGEIGGVNNTQAPSRTVGGAIRVASTGPYSVTMNSANGYRMTFPGGNPDIANQSIRYSARLLGQIRDSGRLNFNLVTCSRAGVAGQNLAVAATLQEGGQGKAPSPNYRDTLTVTVTPLAVPHHGSTANCPAL